MENLLDLIYGYLQDNGYKVLEKDDNGCVTIRHELKIVHICPIGDSQEFVNMIMPGIDDFTPETAEEVYAKCTRFNAAQRVVKVYPQADDVVATYEFFTMTEDNLYYQIKKGLDLLAEARPAYKAAGKKPI